MIFKMFPLNLRKLEANFHNTDVKQNSDDELQNKNKINK